MQTEQRIESVLVVVPPRLLLLDIAGPIEVLRKVNQIQDTVRFDIRYVGPAPSIESSIGLGLYGIAELPEQVDENALVLLAGNVTTVLGPGTGTDPSADDAMEEEIVDWLRRCVGAQQRLVCICNGAFYAARAGLLDGRECTTHHSCTAELQAFAPQARVLENRIFVEDGTC